MPTSEKDAHTPGPWLNEAGVRIYTQPEGNIYRVAVGSRPDNGKDILCAHHDIDETTIANLQLAAAAPDLLAALERIEQAVQNGFPRYEKNAMLYEIGRIIEPAIAKARGA